MDLATLWNRHKAALHALRAGRSAAAVAAELGLPVCALEGLRPFTGASAPKGGQDSQALPLASPAPPGVLYPLAGYRQRREAIAATGAGAPPVLRTALPLAAVEIYETGCDSAAATPRCLVRPLQQIAKRSVAEAVAIPLVTA